MEPLTATYLSLMLLTVGVIAISLVFNAAGQRLHDRVRLLDARVAGLLDVNASLNRRLADVEEQVGNTTDYCTTNELHNDDVGETLESNARDIEALRAEVFSGSALIDNMAANNSETRKIVTNLDKSLGMLRADISDLKRGLGFKDGVLPGGVGALTERVEALERWAEGKNEDDNHAESRLDELSDGLALVREHASGTSFSITDLYDKVNKLQLDGASETADDLRESMLRLAQQAVADRDLLDELRATIRNLLKELPTIHACQRSLWARIYPLEKRVTAVEGQPELVRILPTPDGGIANYKTDGTIDTTYPDGTVVTDRPCKDDKVDGKVYSVWDDRPEAPPGYEIIKRVQLDTNGKCIYLMQRTNPGATQ